MAASLVFQRTIELRQLATEVEPPLANPTALWLSGIAVLVTLIGVGVQARLWYLAGPRLRVDLGTATLISEKGSRGGITIDVVNTGRAATTISRWFVRNVDGTGQLGPDGTEITGGPKLPHKLDAHERAFWRMDLNYARHALLADDPEQIIRLEALVLYGPRTAKSKQRIKLRMPGNFPREKGIRASIDRVRGRFRPGMMSRVMSPFSAPKDLGSGADRAPSW
jgi:hypothetical protein